MSGENLRPRFLSRDQALALLYTEDRNSLDKRVNLADDLSARLSLPEAAGFLIELFGGSLQEVANAVGLSRGESVLGWSERKSRPRNSEVAPRLKLAVRLAAIVFDTEKIFVTRDWFLDPNLHFNGFPPAEILSKWSPVDRKKEQKLLNAAKDFPQLQPVA